MQGDRDTEKPAELINHSVHPMEQEQRGEETKAHGGCDPPPHAHTYTEIT